jgi:hypothetical protein
MVIVKMLVSLCHFATKSMIFPIFYHIKDNNKGDNAVRLYRSFRGSPHPGYRTGTIDDKLEHFCTTISTLKPAANVSY